MILVVNGSPHPQGNLHRMLEKIAQDTGRQYEMINLAELVVDPCMGCAACAQTNRCIQQDDMAPLYDRIVAADALVVGGVVYFGHMNALTHTFLERLFPLRHRQPQTLGKLAAAVCVGGHEALQGAREISEMLEKYFHYCMVGSVFFNSATPPCFVCGFGTTCQYGAPAKWMTPEEFADFKEITPEMYRVFEDSPEVVAACQHLSRSLNAAIEALPK
jgi:putative NADPH-quinone reductase